MRLLAHRGYAERFPENTLSAIRAAVEAGAHAVEFDIQLTLDRVPVLLHDASLRRTAGVDRPVFELEARELAGLSAGEATRFGDRFASEPVPRLSEAAALLAGSPQVTAFVEVKGESVSKFGVDAVVGAVVPALAPIQGRCVVISFVLDALVAARRAGALPVGWCLGDYDAGARARARALAPEYLLADHRRLPGGGAPLWAGPWQWVLYEVTDPAVAAALGRRGADIIESMRVEHLLAAGIFERA